MVHFIANPPSPPSPMFIIKPRQKASILSMNFGCCVEPSSVIWIMVTLAVVTVFLVVFYCTMAVACRWIYKRRMKRKCEALMEKYRQEEKQRKLAELNAKRLALQPIHPYQPRDTNKETLDKLCLALNKKTEVLEKQASMANFQQDELRRQQQKPDLPPPTSDLQQSGLTLSQLSSSTKIVLKPSVTTKTTTNQAEKKKLLKEEMKKPKKEENTLKEENKTEEVNVSFEAVDLKEDATQPSNSPDFPYYKKGEKEETKGKKNAPSAVTSSSTFRPPNVYELRDYLRRGIPITSRIDLTQESRTPPTRNRAPPMGFGCLKEAARKSFKECLQTISYPELTSREGKK